MSDIRKRAGKRGVTYQVRYPNSAASSGYSYATFNTLKEARAFREDSGAREVRTGSSGPAYTVETAIQKWLDICEREGRDGRDPVTPYTLKHYQWRAAIMIQYPWPKSLGHLTAPDVIAFRSWLLKNYSRDVARKVLSSFQAVMKEMTNRGFIASNIAATITVRSESRYDEPVAIPTPREVAELLVAADRLANSRNRQTASTWERYRPILYLAVDSGMRPQEYLAIARANLADGGVQVDRAIERGERRLSVTKTRAGRRFIDLSPETFDLVSFYAERKSISNAFDLVFPTASGRWQSTDNWRKRGFYAACFEAGLVEKVYENGVSVEKPKFKPYDLRHFYASMLIEQKLSLKRIQALMGHEDITTTLNVYGHLIERTDEPKRERVTMLQHLPQNPCGESVANPRYPAEI